MSFVGPEEAKQMVEPKNSVWVVLESCPQLPLVEAKVVCVCQSKEKAETYIRQREIGFNRKVIGPVPFIGTIFTEMRPRRDPIFNPDSPMSNTNNPSFNPDPDSNFPIFRLSGKNPFVDNVYYKKS